VRLPRRPAVRRRSSGTGVKTAARRRPGTTRGARQGLRTAGHPAASSVAGARARAARRNGLTNRAAVLGVALCAVALTVAYPLREFVSQRSEISKLAGSQRAQEHRVAVLEARKGQLQDPAYVESLARQRLHFVRPGETVYVVVAPSEPVAPADGRGAAAPQRRPAPWYGQLWATVDGAGQVPAGPVAQPGR